MKNPAAQSAAVNAANSWANSPTPGYTPPGETSNIQTSAAAPVPSDFNVDEQTLKAMGQYHLALRVLYSTAAIFLGVAGGLSLVNQTNLGIIFFAFYVLFFAMLLCCFEIQLQVLFISNLFASFTIAFLSGRSEIYRR